MHPAPFFVSTAYDRCDWKLSTKLELLKDDSRCTVNLRLIFHEDNVYIHD